MKVELLTSKDFLQDMVNDAVRAAQTCYASEGKDVDTKEFLLRIIDKGHESILEHISLKYKVNGLSRACLQELARHRLLSLSVESTRHTLKKKLQDKNAVEQILKDVHDILPSVVYVNLTDFFKHFAGVSDVTLNGNPFYCEVSSLMMVLVEYMSKMGKGYEVIDGKRSEEVTPIPNDELKYFLPEFWPTNLYMTVNLRELRHILDLRTASNVLKEFRVLCHEMFNAVPDEFKYLLKDCVHEEV